MHAGHHGHTGLGTSEAAAQADTGARRRSLHTYCHGVRHAQLSDQGPPPLSTHQVTAGIFDSYLQSHNALESLSGLPVLPALEQLDVRSNQLAEVSDLCLDQLAALPRLQVRGARGCLLLTK